MDMQMVVQGNCMTRNQRKNLTKAERSLASQTPQEQIITWENIHSSVTGRDAEPLISGNSNPPDQERLRFLFETMSLGVVFQDELGTIIHANLAAQKTLGIPLEQLCGRNSLDPRWKSIHEDRTEFPGDTHPAMVALRTGQPVRNIVMGVFNPELNAYRWININAIPHFDADDRLTGVQVTFEDFTERKLAESALRVSEENYRSLAENSESAITMIDRDGRLLYANSWTIHVWKDPAVVGKTIFDLFPSEYAQRYSAAIKSVIDTGTSIFDDVETSINGKTMWFRLSMSPIRDIDGSINTLLVNAWDVTGHKLAEHALRENSRILQESQAIAHLGAWTADLRARTFNTSPEAAQIIGCQPGLLRLDNLMEIVHPDDRGTMRNSWEAAIKEGNYEIEHRILVRGEVRWTHVKAIFNLAPDGTPVSASGITQDITERKRADIALAASEEKYRGLMESMDSIISSIDYDGRILYMNDVAAKELDGVPADFTGKTMHDIFPEPFASKQLEIVRKVIREDAGTSVESESVVKERARWYRTSIQPIHNEAGQVVYALLNIMDIHSLKMAQHEMLAWSQTLEERVRERTLEIQDLYDNAPTGYHSVDNQGNFVMMNKTELNWLGYTHDDVLGHPAFDFMVPSSRSSYLENFVLFKKQGWMKDLELEFVRKDGTLLPVSLSSVAVYDRNGNYSFSRSTVFDDTERKRAEQELRESEERYRKAISAADAVPYSLDYASNTYLFMGDGIEKISGYSREEMTPALFESLIEKTSMQGDLRSFSTEEATRQVRAGEADAVHAVWRSDFLIRHKNGEGFWLSDVSLQVLDVNGKPVGSIGILQNITDRKRVEEVLRNANIEMERALRIKDEFLTSMSHELRTPLTGILGLSEALQYETYGMINTDQKNALANIEKSGRHLLDLINDILDISKLEAGKLDVHMEPIPVREICEAALQLTKGMAHKKSQTVEYSMGPASMIVLGDARRLKQILVNLLSNAIKYSHEGSRIGLEVKEDRQSGTVMITVWDNGIGISPEDLKKLFQPFVQLDSSLTRQQNGTGLGLALVQRLVDLHSGNVKVASDPGRGSRFMVTLPMLPEDVVQMRRKNLSLLTRPHRAFIVEGNHLDADRLSQNLRVLGVESETYASGMGVLERALEVRPQMIYLNLLLPEASGWDVLDQLKGNELTSGIPVIVTSVMDVQELAIQKGAAGYLPKLFTQSDLYQTLERIQDFVDVSSRKNSDTSALSNQPTARVMIVDDNEVNIFMLRDFLQSKHFDVMMARSGFEFLSRVPEVQPDVVLMDVQMPGMDGLETIRRLRSNPDLRIAAVPVIAITALAMPGDRERCLQAGANEYISKPMHLDQLSATIQRISKKDS